MKKLAIISLIVIILLVIIILAVVCDFFKGSRSKELKVFTDQKEYESGNILKLNIENNLDKKVCFSSCYPYYFEKKEGEEWNLRPWPDCLIDNLVEKCIEPGRIKAFNLIVEDFDHGSFRLAIPICIECNIGDEFRQDQSFYSNEFIIK